MRDRKFTGLASSVALLLSVSACDWVDSTGTQLDSAPQTTVFLDDVAVGSVLAIEENSSARVLTSRDVVADGESLQFSWSDSPLAEGALDVCANVAGFQQAFAASNLDSACTDSDQCSLSFVPQAMSDPNVVEFLVGVPTLQASVGVRHELTVTDTSGEIVSQNEFDFCLIATNDPPVAVADTFVVVEGTRLTVDPLNPPHLLSNDTDDVDVTNNPELTVLPTTVREPQFAAFFQLQNDGGFSYEYGGDPILADIIDRFDYQITDGLSTSTATVTLRIVASNQAPQLVEDLPLFSATVGDDVEIDLAQFFIDPEGVDLSFDADETTLPPSGNLELDNDGFLEGEVDATDVGSYVVVVTASDGGRTVAANVSLEIFPASLVPDNSPPVFVSGSVFDQSITLGQQIAVIRPLFNDPDGDILSYQVIGGALPAGVSINSLTGVISGRPLGRLWVRNLQVEAEDEAGNTAESSLFDIRVR